jgi:hypothetical protein
MGPSENPLEVIYTAILQSDSCGGCSLTIDRKPSEKP